MPRGRPLLGRWWPANYTSGFWMGTEISYLSNRRASAQPALVGWEQEGSKKEQVSACWQRWQGANIRLARMPCLIRALSIRVR